MKLRFDFQPVTVAPRLPPSDNGAYEFKGRLLVQDGKMRLEGDVEAETEYVQILVSVRREDRDWFQRFYPMRGAWSWFTRTGLRMFREVNTVELDDLVEQGMRELARQP